MSAPTRAPPIMTPTLVLAAMLLAGGVLASGIVAATQENGARTVYTRAIADLDSGLTD